MGNLQNIFNLLILSVGKCEKQGLAPEALYQMNLQYDPEI